MAGIAESAIKERTPVAFVRLPPNRKDGMSRLALVDHDGYILRPCIAAQFTLPVLAGLRESESLEDRRARVRRALAMLKDVGPLASQISEVNVADPNNLVVAEHVGNSVINLLIGDENLHERLQNFLANYDGSGRNAPMPQRLILRVDGVITAVGEKN